MAEKKEELYKAITCTCEWKLIGIGLPGAHAGKWINGHVIVTNEVYSHRWHWFIKCFHKVSPTEKFKRKLSPDSINRVLLRTGGLCIFFKGKDGINIRLDKPQDPQTLLAIKKRIELIIEKNPSPIPPDVASKSVSLPRKSTHSTSTPTPRDSIQQSRDGAATDASEKDAGVVTPSKPQEQMRPQAKSVPSKQYLEVALKKSTNSLSEAKNTNSFYKTSSTGWGQNVLTTKSLNGSVQRKPGLLSVKGSRSVDYSWAKLKATSPFKKEQSASKLQGFSNLGNTCYMNAILQSLFSLDSFAADLLTSAKIIDTFSSHFTNKGNLLRALSRLLQANKNSVSSDQKSSLLLLIKKAISTSAKRFLGHEQHDAHEFLCQILDQLKEEIISLNKDFIKVQEMEENAAVPQLQGASLHNPTAENFECEVQHSISCLECGETLTKCEVFNDLSLEMPRKADMFDEKSLQDALDQFFNSEKIEYKCEKCSSNKAFVKHELVKLPRVFIIHLKRYAFNTVHGKIGRTILIPRFLTLDHLCCDVKSPPQPIPMPKLDDVKHVAEKGQENKPLAVETPKQKFTFKRSAQPIVIEDEDVIQQKKFKPVNKHVNRSLFLESTPPRRETLARPKSFSDYRLDCSEEEQLKMALEMSMNESSQGPDGIVGQVDGIFDDVDEEIQFKKAVKDEGNQSDAKWSISPISLSDKPTSPLEKTPKWDKDLKPEDQDLDAAIQQSRKEHETEEDQFNEELERVKEMSLMDMYPVTQSQDSTEVEDQEESFHDDISEDLRSLIKENCETGDLKHSFQLSSVVSHFGSSSVGHYISDIYNVHSDSWLSCDDSSLRPISEADVLSKRIRSGYIFFYVNKSIISTVKSQDAGKSPRVLNSSNRPLSR